MNRWIKVGNELPQSGDIVNIKIAGGIVKKRVLFEDGIFWKLRKARNVGHPWIVSEWQSTEKITKKPKYDNAAMDEEYEQR